MLLSLVSPFAESVIVEVRAFNATGFSEPAEISISLPGAGSEAVSFSAFSFGSYPSPLGWRALTFENLDESDLFIGTFEESSNVICALDFDGVACTSAMDILFPEPVWSLEVRTGGDEFAGVQGELELEVYDGFESSFVTVQLVGDGDPASVEIHDLSEYGTVVAMTWIPDANVGLTGFARFAFVTQAGVIPDPPTFAPSARGPGPLARPRGR